MLDYGHDMSKLPPSKNHITCGVFANPSQSIPIREYVSLPQNVDIDAVRMSPLPDLIL